MPENWKTYKLKDIVDQDRGISYGIVQPGQHDPNGVPILKINNLTGNSFNINELHLVSKKVEEKYKKTRLRGGELLVSLVGSLGEVFTVPTEMIGYNVVRALAVIPVLKEFSPNWVMYYLRAPFAQNILQQIATTSVQATINLKELREINIPFPEKNERDSIASILSALDDKIELNLQMNKTLEEIAMALYKHWFIDFGPFQDGEFVASELGEIPEGWEVKSVGQVVKIIGGFAFKSKDFKERGETVVKIKNISNNLVSIEGSDCIGYDIGAKTNKKFLINSGSFLIAMTGAEVGKVGVVPDYSQKLWLNQRVGMITAPSFESADILIGNFLQSSDGYETIQNLAYGSAQPNISTNGLESISLPIPGDILVIAEFLKKIDNWHHMKISNYTENQTLTQLRDTLLPKLISGEVRVKDVEKTLTEVL